MKITHLTAREILDSKGQPTVEAEVWLENGVKALGQVPSGASTGASEAAEIRDNDQNRYLGKGVTKAVSNIKGEIAAALVGLDVTEQEVIDNTLIKLDGTENKSRLGGNALVGVSMAVCRAAARELRTPLYKYFGQLSGNTNFLMPQALILILEGGKHGNWATDLQEYFIIPLSSAFPSFSKRLQVGCEVFYSLEKILQDRGYSTGVGFEGAFCPREIKSNEEAFQLMIQAVESSGYKMEKEVLLGIDAASTSFYTNGEYVLRSEGHTSLSSRAWSEKVGEWLKKYPIWLLEDIHAEEDWEEWGYFTNQWGSSHQIIGDDLLTTNTKRIQRAIDQKSCNSVLIKLNQIGTVTETIQAIKMAHSAGMNTVISHRGGETNDDMIADLVVGSGSWQCKFGGPDRGERIAKYNRLLRIEEMLTT